LWWPPAQLVFETEVIVRLTGLEYTARAIIARLTGLEYTAT